MSVHSPFPNPGAFAMTARLSSATTTHAAATQRQLSRRGVLRAGTATGLATLWGGAGLLAGCGDGAIVSALTPNRFISFGDGLSDLGQGSTGTRYTINDGTVNTWVDRMASRYGKTVTAQKSGGLGYAQGHGPTQALPRTLATQIDAFLSTQSLVANDVVLLNLPMSDVLSAMAAVKTGTLTEAAALAQVDSVGRAHVVQVKRLLAAGAKYLLVLGVYNLGTSPFAIAQAQTTLASSLTQTLNDAFKTDAVALGANLLFVDAAFLVNRNVLNANAHGFSNVNTAICTTADASTCNTGTLVSGATASQYVFADGIHLTPTCNQQLGDYAYDQLRARW
jgi:phospholipase/lecithinase/hemolysin